MCIFHEPFIKEIILFTSHIADTFVQSDLQMRIKQVNQHEDSRGQKQRKNWNPRLLQCIYN